MNYIPYRSNDIIDDWIQKQRWLSNFKYEDQLEQKAVNNLFKCLSEKWALPFYIFTYNYVNSGIE